MVRKSDPAMIAVCRLGVEISSPLPRICWPLSAGASRTCQHGWLTLAARYSQEHSAFRHRPFHGSSAWSHEDTRRISCWQADEVLADRAGEVVSAVMAPVGCNGTLKVHSGAEQWTRPCLDWAA